MSVAGRAAPSQSQEEGIWMITQAGRQTFTQVYLGGGGGGSWDGSPANFGRKKTRLNITSCLCHFNQTYSTFFLILFLVVSNFFSL